MASDLATRAPLMQKQSNNGQELFVPSETANRTRNEHIFTGDLQHAYPGLSIPYNSGFRYQIRRPVESWKFIETRKHDGSLLYLCRVCSSSYKHKKSLNKHWKDKHSDVPRPEGSHPDEEDDEEEDEGEDGSEDENSCVGTTAAVDVENTENVDPSLWGHTGHETGSPESHISRPVLTNAPAIASFRRSSLPLKRPIHRPFHPGRMSMLPKVSTEDARSPLLPLNRIPRKRTYGPSQFNTDTTRTKRVSLDTHVQFQSPCTQLRDRPIQEQNENYATFRPAQLHHERVVQKSPSGEAQPLDLTTIKSGATKLDKQRHDQQTRSRCDEPKNPVNRTLIIGLLQTALNTLNSETQKEAPTDVDSDEANTLSKTSASLLYAIGTLLITFVDGSKRSSSPPTATPAPESPVASSVQDEAMASAFQTPSNRHTVTPQSVGHYSPMERSFASFAEDPAITSEANILEQQYQHLSDFENAFPLNLTGVFNPVVSRILTNPLVATHGKSTSILDHPELSSSSVQPPSSDARTSVEGNIICPVCNFDARWFSELRAHMVNHSTHRMFGCCYCPYRAKWKWDVAKHMRRCPLGRHVVHLTNEALLRIVRYHPPPRDDILYSYFPQDVFPGVGIDRPPTPPEREIHLNRSAYCIVNEPKIAERTAAPHPPTLRRYTSTSSDEQSTGTCPPMLRRQDVPTTVSEEESPKALIIVDEHDPSPIEVERSRPDESETHTEVTDSSDKKSLHVAENESASLVFRLRKCAQCSFCASEEQELFNHSRAHEQSEGGQPCH